MKFPKQVSCQKKKATLGVAKPNGLSFGACLFWFCIGSPAAKIGFADSSIPPRFSRRGISEFFPWGSFPGQGKNPLADDRREEINLPLLSPKLSRLGCLTTPEDSSLGLLTSLLLLLGNAKRRALAASSGPIPRPTGAKILWLVVLLLSAAAPVPAAVQVEILNQSPWVVEFGVTNGASFTIAPGSGVPVKIPDYSGPFQIWDTNGVFLSGDTDLSPFDSSRSESASVLVYASSGLPAASVEIRGDLFHWWRVGFFVVGVPIMVFRLAIRMVLRLMRPTVQEQ